MLANMIVHNKKIVNSKSFFLNTTCDSKPKNKSSSLKLMSYLEHINITGLSGNIEFNKRLRTNLKLSIVNKKKETTDLVILR